MLMYESPFMQHWLPQWLGVGRQQDIVKANTDSNQCCHVASLGHNELSSLTVLRSKHMLVHFNFRVRFRSEIYLILWKLKGSILSVWKKEVISVNSGSTHWGRDKMAAISQTTFSNTFFACKCMTFTSGFTEVYLWVFIYWILLMGIHIANEIFHHRYTITFEKGNISITSIYHSKYNKDTLKQVKIILQI